MRIYHPETAAARAARDQMLTRALRPGSPLPFPIAAEYPIVLSEHGSRYSYCLGHEPDVVCHANLWPRTLIDRTKNHSFRIGLVGNVATDENRRGQGLMRRMLDTLKAEATKLDLSALVLWSDLLEFYQKQGFTSFGREKRYLYKTARLPEPRHAWQLGTPRELDAKSLQGLLQRRFESPATLQRSPEEFHDLLTIPVTDLWLRRDDLSYVIMGKGADMVGVVHEWGAKDPETLLAALRVAASARGYEEVMLLTPYALPASWTDVLGEAARDVQTHAMALAWLRTEQPQDIASLERSFIWGLDSI